MLTYDEPNVLSVTHYSPMMGQPDEPENYHTARLHAHRRPTAAPTSS